MIEVTPEMIQAFEDAAGECAAIAVRDGLAAALAVVERDRCLKARDHVFHPLARPVRIPHCPVVDDLCPGDSRGVLCLTSCGGS